MKRLNPDGLSPQDMELVEKIRLETPLNWKESYGFVSCPTLDVIVRWRIYGGFDLNEYLKPKERK